LNGGNYLTNHKRLCQANGGTNQGKHYGNNQRTLVFG
jgi:hypothetical protein